MNTSELKYPFFIYYENCLYFVYRAGVIDNIVYGIHNDNLISYCLLLDKLSSVVITVRQTSSPDPHLSGITATHFWQEVLTS